MKIRITITCGQCIKDHGSASVQRSKDTLTPLSLLPCDAEMQGDARCVLAHVLSSSAAMVKLYELGPHRLCVQTRTCPENLCNTVQLHGDSLFENNINMRYIPLAIIWLTSLICTNGNIGRCFIPSQNIDPSSSVLCTLTGNSSPALQTGIFASPQLGTSGMQMCFTTKLLQLISAQPPMKANFITLQCIVQ